jgi:hypothetical protein
MPPTTQPENNVKSANLIVERGSMDSHSRETDATQSSNYLRIVRAAFKRWRSVISLRKR